MTPWVASCVCATASLSGWVCLGWSFGPFVDIPAAIIWVFPKIGGPQNGWFIMETPIKMDDLGASLFLETPICGGGAWAEGKCKFHTIAP